MSKTLTHTADITAVLDALATTAFESDVGTVRLGDLSPAGAVHFMAYGILQSTRDASAAVKAKAQTLALKAVLTPESLGDDDLEELKKLEAVYDDGVDTDADKALFRAVARGFIASVAQSKGIKLTAKAIANGVETFMGPSGSKAPSYPALMKVFGLTKGVVMEAKRKRLAACIDGTVGAERARGGNAEADGSLDELGLFD